MDQCDKPPHWESVAGGGHRWVVIIAVRPSPRPFAQNRSSDEDHSAPVVLRTCNAAQPSVLYRQWYIEHGPKLVGLVSVPKRRGKEGNVNDTETGLATLYCFSETLFLEAKECTFPSYSRLYRRGILHGYTRRWRTFLKLIWQYVRGVLICGIRVRKNNIKLVFVICIVLLWEITQPSSCVRLLWKTFERTIRWRYIQQCWREERGVNMNGKEEQEEVSSSISTGYIKKRAGSCVRCALYKRCRRWSRPSTGRQKVLCKYTVYTCLSFCIVSI